MPRHSGLGISAKLLLTSVSLVLLAVTVFGIASVVNLELAFSRAARDEISTFRTALRDRGETGVEVLAEAASYALRQEPPDTEVLEALMSRALLRDPGLQTGWILDADRQVAVTCHISPAAGGPSCQLTPAGMRSSIAGHPGWPAVLDGWRARVASGSQDALVTVEDSAGGHLLFVQGVCAHETATPGIALAESHPERLGYAMLSYSLQPIADIAATSRSELAEAKSSAILRMAVFGMVVLLIAMVIALLQGNRIARPLRTMVWQADRMAQGDLSTRVEVSSAGEVGALAEHFNFMADRMATLIEGVGERAQQDKELELARVVQETLVPSNHPVECGALSFAGYSQPASTYSGDWWTYHRLPDGRVVLLIADAAGRGTPSAVLSAVAKAAFDAAVSVGGDDISVPMVLATMNRAIHKNQPHDLVMSCFAAIVDPTARVITYANAGHCFPYLYRVAEDGRGEFGSLMIRGARLGKEEDAVYESRTTQLRTGDTLIWYTGGVVQCENQDGEAYGEKRFRASIGKAAHLAVGDVRNTVIADAMGFYGKAPRKADITLVVGRIR